MTEEVDIKKLTEFQECDTCAALPGTPPLCRGCLHNRELINYLYKALKISASSPYGKFRNNV